MPKYYKRRYKKRTYKKRRYFKKKAFKKKRMMYSSEQRLVKITMRTPLQVYARGGNLFASMQIKVIPTITNVPTIAGRQISLDNNVEYIARADEFMFTKIKGCSIKYTPATLDQADNVPRAPQTACYLSNAAFIDTTLNPGYTDDVLARAQHPRNFQFFRPFKTYFKISRFTKERVGSATFPNIPPAFASSFPDWATMSWVTSEVPLGAAVLGTYAAGENIGRFEVTWYCKFYSPRV